MADEKTINVDPATGEVVSSETEDVATLVLADESTRMVQGLACESETRITAFGFDPETPEGIRDIFNAEEDGLSLSEAGITELVLRGIIIRPGVRVNPVTGARTPCANTILMATDNHNYVSQSNGIARTAARIANMFGKAWPEGGVAVKVDERKLSNGTTYKKLLLA